MFMSVGLRVFQHCGSNNFRITAHLGLIVPNGLSLRVANQTSGWSEGEVTVFDDSFEHEVNFAAAAAANSCSQAHIRFAPPSS